MYLTLTGALTATGLLVTWWFVSRANVCSCVHKAWWAAFLMFCSNSASAGMSSTLSDWLMWSVPIAMLAAFATMWTFYPRRMTLAVWAYAALFLLTLLAGWLRLDKLYWGFPLGVIDVIDLIVWTQIALLWRLRAENPEMGLPPYGQPGAEVYD